MISVFDIFKIGIGPSSSHTVGPMKAGKQFTDDLIARGLLAEVSKVVVDVYGSLSLTGKGHHTDIAIIMGLAGNLPDTVDIDAIPGFIQDVNTHGRLMLANGQHEVDFPVDQCMNFHADNLSLHENGMRITALAGDKVLYSQTYYSIGGGFIVDEEHFGQTTEAPVAVPYPYKNAADLQRHCRETGLSLSGLMMQNELALHSKEALEQHFAAVWEVMSAGIERGITTEGVLPGKLRVPRRAAALRRMLVSQDTTNSDPMAVVDWINMFALAVNEENAAGGRVVTAPTNGACGIVPAVLAYYDKFIRKVNSNSLARYMLVWAKMLLKHPVCYFEATHANSHGYYTITKCRAINDYYTFNNDICMEMSEMNVHYLDKSGYLRYAFVQALSAFEKLPLVGLTTSIGFMAWLTAVLGLWLARCKAKPVLPVFIGLGIFWLTCIASPVNDCMRYFLPVAGCLPLVFCLAAVFSREKSEITV